MLPYDEAGGGPAVVLLHAGIADRSEWDLDTLAEAGFRAVAVDLPGFGDAPVPPGEQAPWTDVLDTMDGLGIERAAVVGNSFGCAVALRVAVAAPERVSALVLLSGRAPGAQPSPELAAAWQAEEDAIERGDIDAALHAVVDAWTLPGASDDLRARVAAWQRRAYDLQGFDEEPPDAPDPLDLDPEWPARLTMPVLLAAGEHEFPDFRQGVADMAALLPHARTATVAGAGHLAPVETPDAFRALLLSFLPR
jgi:pimeloyl-ACP methyl ester carboxylesterase